jgi:YHS domain-containing protein
MEAEMAQVWDVVCGMTTELGNWQSKSEYKGKTYYFCCDGCKGAFEKAAAYYIEEAEKGNAGQGHGHHHM